jgi:hypothetical protein
MRSLLEDLQGLREWIEEGRCALDMMVHAQR